VSTAMSIGSSTLVARIADTVAPLICLAPRADSRGQGVRNPGLPEGLHSHRQRATTVRGVSGVARLESATAG
jgi:hypothetical protein